MLFVGFDGLNTLAAGVDKILRIHVVGGLRSVCLGGNSKRFIVGKASPKIMALLCCVCFRALLGQRVFFFLFSLLPSSISLIREIDEKSTKNRHRVGVHQNVLGTLGEVCT